MDNALSPCYTINKTNNRLDEGEDLRKDSADIKESDRRKAVCLARELDADSGAGFLQRFPESKWLVVLGIGMRFVQAARGGKNELEQRNNRKRERDCALLPP